MPSEDDPTPDVRSSVPEVLAAAVEALGGEHRDGQVQMAQAVAQAMSDGVHLLVQAGTGTGKSLAYLVPALLHDDRVVIATATLALQHQLVERDIPALVEAGKHVLHETPSYAVLKGRSNYACLHRIREGVPDDQGVLVEAPVGSMGSEVLKLREWAETEASDGGRGDRDSAPRHTDRVWRQVSVSHRECLGAAKCPFGAECFAELARDRSAKSQLIVTNHSLLAIDAIEGVPMIPEYHVVVIDEAHELAARVTQAATAELTPVQVERAAKRAGRHVAGSEADDLASAADDLRDALADCDPGRLDRLPDALADALVVVRDSARTLVSAFGKDTGDDAGATQAKGWAQEVFVIAERMAANAESDVLWLTERDTGRGGVMLSVAPLQVWAQLRDRLLASKTVVMTSATLKLGGDFDALATTVGLKPSERVVEDAPPSSPPSFRSKDRSSSPEGSRSPNDRSIDRSPAEIGPDSKDDRSIDRSPAEQGAQPWRGIDVGSPFDYGKQGILYVAAHLPRPGRDGLGAAQLDEIVDLVEAAEGRTLGLFSSRRAAETAAEAVRARLPHLTVLAQGDAQLPELTKQFVADPHTSLFGTLGLWQGVDLPGDTCQLVVIDRIPFPRPDDPLMSARQRAADRAGRNGFMTVAATHAALLMAQGSGRLIRTATDKGVVAVLDPRLSGTSYARFIQASLPPMWRTSDRAVVLGALRRLAAG